MAKIQGCLEVSNVAIKLLLGYPLNGTPIVLYTKKIPLPKGTVSHGTLKDIDAAVACLKELREFKDDSEKIDLKLDNILLVIPSIGLKVYSNDKNFLVAGQDGKITRLDIANLLSLLKKDPVPAGNTIVDIIPIIFQLDDGSRFDRPPLDRISGSITVKAMIHCLPETVSGQYQTMANAAGYRVKKTGVSVYCAAKYFATIPDAPKNYLLLDIGARSTDLALIGDKAPYSATSFARGGDDLTEAIAEAFGISVEDAESLKVDHGYDTRVLSYRPPLIKGIDKESGAPKNYYQKDLNEVIEEYFETFLSELSASINLVLEKHNNPQFNALPFMLTGGASELKGLQDFLRKAFPTREPILIRPTAIGARDPGFTNLLGMLAATGSYSGSLSDFGTGVMNVTREAPKPEKKKPKTSRSSLDDDL